MEHTGHCYDTLASAYAIRNEQQPWYSCYERPAMVSMLPPLEGTEVLDAACGPGWYSEYLSRHGARVTAFDLNPEFVEMTRRRAGPAATLVQADLSRPLDFARDGAFDLVVCPLAMHYLKDWVAPLREFHRVLKSGGLLVFSTHHPFADWQAFDLPDYFSTQLIDDHFSGVGDVRYYRRPLTAMFDALQAASFVVERLLEPRPTEGFRDADPETFEKLSTNPCFLVLRARRA